MPAVKLDQHRVDALKPRKSVYDVRDRDSKGFLLIPESHPAMRRR